MLGGKPLRTFNTQQSGFVGKAPQTYPKGGYTRTLPYGNKSTPRVVAIEISMVVTTIPQYRIGTHEGIRNYLERVGREWGSRGRNPSHRSQQVI